MPSARRFTISGRVQGVFFRESARRVALDLGVTGHAVNLSNGNVEVLACGAPHAVDEFAEWLRQGPRMAQVSNVEAVDVEWQELSGFTTG